MAAILCIDSATATCSVALCRDGKVVRQLTSDRPRSHTEMITVLIDQCMRGEQIHYQDLAAVAVVAGPGSYTSLRIGASTAKGLCYAYDLPLIAVDTLELVVQPVLGILHSDQLAVAMLDARRMEVYTAAFTSRGERWCENEPVIVTEDFPGRFEGHDILLVGDGAAKTQPLLSHGPKVSYSTEQASAADMKAIAYSKLHSKDFVDVAYWEPNYTKPVRIIKSKKKLL